MTYKTEWAVTANGNRYKRFVRDMNGNKIPAEAVSVAVKSTDKAVKNPKRKSIKRIVPQHVLQSMNEATQKAASYADGKTLFRILITEQKVTGKNTGWVIMTIDKPSAQLKTIFFNLVTEQWKTFTDADKPGYGNAAIIWPK